MFKKSDLNPNYKYNDRHDEGDNPKKIGHPDKDLLDRTEAYEMVDFINHILNTWNWDKPKPLPQDVAIPTGKKIEMLIKKHLPSDIRSRDKISTWLFSNWNAVFPS